MKQLCLAVVPLILVPSGIAEEANDRRTTQIPRILVKNLGFIESLDFSPDGKQILVAGRGKEKTVRVLDVRTGDEVLALKHRKFVSSAAFSPDGKHIAVASWDKSAIIWNVAKRKQVKRLKGHTSFVYGIAYSPSGKRIATTGRDDTVRLWDVESGEADFVAHVDIGAPRNVAFSPDEKWIASPNDDTTVKLWNVATGAEAKKLLDGHPSRVISVAFSPDGRQLAVACGGGNFNYTPEGEVKIWDVATQNELQTLKHNSRVASVAYRFDGKQIAAACGPDVLLWDLSTSEVVRKLDCGYSLTVAFSPDEKQLVTGGRHGSVKLWDVQP